MKYLFKDFEDSLLKQACYIKQAQLNWYEQLAKFPKWLEANNYGTNVPKETLTALDQMLQSLGSFIRSGVCTFTSNSRKAGKN